MWLSQSAKFLIYLLTKDFNNWTFTEFYAIHESHTCTNLKLWIGNGWSFCDFDITECLNLWDRFWVYRAVIKSKKLKINFKMFEYIKELDKV